jgi:hypothetical protein
MFPQFGEKRKVQLVNNLEARDGKENLVFRLLLPLWCEQDPERKYA